MPNKPRNTAYAEFRHFAEWRPKGMTRIKRELIPPLAAYLVMLAKRYERCAEGFESKLVTRTVPGMKEAAERMRFATEHLQWIMDAITENFKSGDWQEAVAEIRQLMNIHDTSVPIMDIPDAQFANLVTVSDAGDSSGAGADAPVRATAPAVGVQPGRPGTRPNGRRTSKKHLGTAPGG